MRLLLTFALAMLVHAPVWADTTMDEALKHFNSGNSYFKEGKFDDAIPEFEEAVRLNPRFAMAYSFLGACYVSKGKYGLAIRQVEEAIKLDPQEAGYHYNLGMVYVKKDQYELAIKPLEEAVRLNPKLAEARKVLDQLYKLRGQRTKEDK
ncbi:MAG: tetratricopeptide repeat protein [Candidatus Brocadiales bacterium]|nr:tetratricopeptide repeat protein [Candidatus Bathyanammoxibius sp.]MCQ4574821.1 tetratricopeptide repeat protein [Candidatus Bathyanammoxibius amoris]